MKKKRVGVLISGHGSNMMALVEAVAEMLRVAQWVRRQRLPSSATIGKGAVAIAYIQVKLPDGRTRWGAAVDTNIELASIKAVLSAVNRAGPS